MSSLPQQAPPRRACTKFRHETWESAAQERRSARGRALARGDSDRHQVYHCGQCQAFHVGRVAVAKRGG